MPSDLQPDDHAPGDAALALDGGAFAAFVRGNLVIVVRSAGLEPVDVRALARRIDAWLVHDAGPDPAARASAARRAVGLPRTGISGPSAALPVPGWLRWRDASAAGDRQRAEDRRSEFVLVTPPAFAQRPPPDALRS